MHSTPGDGPTTETATGTSRWSRHVRGLAVAALTTATLVCGGTLTTHASAATAVAVHAPAATIAAGSCTTKNGAGWGLPNGAGWGLPTVPGGGCYGAGWG